MTRKDIEEKLRSIEADNFMNAAGPPRDGLDVLAVAAMVVSLTTERDQLRDALQALYDTVHADPGTPLYKEYQLALLRAEKLLKEDEG